jgi:hypothetical protein
VCSTQRITHDLTEYYYLQPLFIDVALVEGLDPEKAPLAR